MIEVVGKQLFAEEELEELLTAEEVTAVPVRDVNAEAQLGLLAN